MKTDQELLREFVRSHAEEAFADLVKRHIGLVYAAACRETNGDTATAQDVTQLVFIELVRKAASLQSHPTLVGWLYRCVRLVNANARRTEQRRINREGNAHAMDELLHTASNDPAWEELRPVLDDVMHELSEEDRDAVLLRYFKGRTLREVGHSLSLTENAARMRVDRALEKLQRLLVKRGINSTGSVLEKTLAAGVVVAPPAFIAAVTSSALAAAAIPVTSTLLGITTMAKMKLIGLGALAITAAGLVSWEEHGRRSALHENRLLQEQVKRAEPLRETNERLLEQIQALESLRQNEQRELLRFRAQASVSRNSGTNPTEQNLKPEIEWRERFDELYKLREGEIIRRVEKPFSPEREAFYRQEIQGGVPRLSGPKELPDYFVFEVDENGRRGRSSSGYTGGRTTLDHVLRYALHLGREEYAGANELFGLEVNGDWVIRKGTSIEARLAALEPILLKATGRQIRFEKKATESDAIIVRGKFSLPQGQHLDIFAEAKEMAGGGAGDLKTLFKDLGDRFNIPFINEAALQNSTPIEWFFHTDARFDRGVDKPGMLEKVLENLNRQTSLQFEVQRRPFQTWVVHE